MKLKFKAIGGAPHPHVIEGETVNGIDLTALEYGGAFVPTEQTTAAGILAAYRDAQDVLHVTLAERCTASRVPETPAHWRGSETEIDADAYDPEVCHLMPTGLTGLVEGVDYEIVWCAGWLGEEGWTVEPVRSDDDA
jgi:hypothetical protein